MVRRSGVRKHCPKTSGWSEWPAFGAVVDAASSQQTVRFSTDEPKHGMDGPTMSDEPGTPAA